MQRIFLLLAVMAVALVVASGVALAVTKIGTDGDDNLRGTNGSDKLVGMGGDDSINGRAGEDVIIGGRGNEGFEGFIVGLYGGKGADDISGGPGSDSLIDGPIREFAVDRILGGDGNDYIATFNIPASRDIVICGDGNDDFAVVDRKDIVLDDCERVNHI
jgi:Ca2+-binding RTX toxin-like protein